MFISLALMWHQFDIYHKYHIVATVERVFFANKCPLSYKDTFGTDAKKKDLDSPRKPSQEL